MTWIGKNRGKLSKSERGRSKRIVRFSIVCPVILIIACFTFFGTVFAAYPNSTPIQTQYPAIGKVVGRGEVEENDQGQIQTVYYGSGVYVAEMGELGILLTNWHVVNGSNGLLQINFPNFQSEGSVLLIDEVWDLTAIVIRRPPFLPFPISLEVPQIGDELWVAGYGQDAGLGGFQMSSGPVLCYSFLGTNDSLPGETLAIGCGVRHGDSGGPILNRYGELAGLLWGSEGLLTMGTFCLRLQAFLSQAQFQLFNRTQSANQFFTDARAGKIEPKRITMPSTPARNALVASGVFPISSRPVYSARRLPPPRLTVPIYYKPAFKSDVAETSEPTKAPNAGNDSLGLPSKETTSEGEPSPEFLQKRKEYLEAHRNGFQMPPYPAVESPTLLAQRKTIGRRNPEVYTADFLASFKNGGENTPDNKNELLGREEVVTTAVARGDPLAQVDAASEEAVVRLTPKVPDGIGNENRPVSASFQPVSLNDDQSPADEQPTDKQPAGELSGDTEQVADAEQSADAETSAEEESAADSTAKKPLRERIPGFSKLPLGDIQTIIVVVIILFLFLNSMRLLAIAAERGKKKDE